MQSSTVAWEKIVKVLNDALLSTSVYTSGSSTRPDIGSLATPTCLVRQEPPKIRSLTNSNMPELPRFIVREETPSRTVLCLLKRIPVPSPENWHSNVSPWPGLVPSRGRGDTFGVQAFRGGQGCVSVVASDRDAFQQAWNRS